MSESMDALLANAKADSERITQELAQAIAHDPEVQPAQDAGQASQEKDSKVTLVPLAQFSEGTPQSYYLKGLCPKNGLGQIMGESGAAKSFVALDMAYALATGRNWFKWKYSRSARENKPLVVYLVLEGAGGFRRRIKALLQRERKNPDNAMPEPDNFVLSDSPFDISSLDDRHALVQSIKAMAGERGVVLFIDTMAQAMPALDENSSQDMGALLKYVEEIQQELSRDSNCFLWLIAHMGKTGKASQGSRGWSGLKAPMDVQIAVEKPSGNSEIRHFCLVKNKDGIEGEKCSFILQGSIVGVDEDGEDIESATVEPCPEAACSILLSEDEKKALDALRHAYEIEGVKIGQRIQNATWIKTYQKDMSVDYVTAKNKVNYFGTTLQEKKVLILDKEQRKKFVRLFEDEVEPDKTPWDDPAEKEQEQLELSSCIPSVESSSLQVG